MNNKVNILDAWIMVEKLSEGSIDLKDYGMRTFDNQINDWERMLLDFLVKHKEKEKLSDRDFDKSGIALFFGIFDFEEVLRILRDKYKIPVSLYEERSNSKKFSFVIFLDNQLRFQSNKFFYTMSGYIRNHGDFPEDIKKEEDSLCDYFSGKFAEESFNAVLFRLFNECKVNLNNFRYKFVRNLEYDAINMHSFFIRDLEKAKNIDTGNLNRYFNGYLKEKKINLDSNKDSSGFQPKVFEDILQPKYYPEGRFPSDTDYALAFMQQVATNIAINYPDNIRSVNGPPGTGKTTLLKDIFAHILVCQAVSICQLHDKKIRGSLAYWDQAKIGVLPANIAGGNIVVASSNNGAVQNIVNELPLKDNISSEFLEKLLEVDYFKDISNSVIEGVGFGKERRINLKKREDKNWGTFSLEGGTATNVNNLLLVIEAIEKELDESYCPNERIYQEFLHLYNRMLAQKQKFQQHYEQWKKFYELKNEYEECSSRYKRDKKSKEFDLASAQKNITKEIETYEQKNRMILDKLDDISHTIDILNDSLKQAERSYDLIRSQEPSLMWFQKIFNKSKVEQYFEDLNRANSVLNDLVDQKRELLESQACYEKSLRENNRRINIFQSERQNMNVQFNQWLNRQQSQLKQLEKRINQLNSLKLLNKVKELDFSQTYCDLQKSNPWFDKDFRVMQTELFIAALKVKKQFLYDNRKNLSKARMIWRKQADYISKVNGSQIIGTAWQWLNCAIPVISTTFASLGIMFGNLPENSISNVFIDEAGQALPQASVGAIFRSKRVMAVGDPAQIRPVLTLDSNTLNLIGRHYDVSEKFVSAIASTQTIMDDASRFGFWKDKDKEEWIGIPLWVHRRSNYPMFTISNEISYNGLMVQGKPDEKAYGKAKWYAVTGKANDKFVKEQADLLIKLISECIQKDVQLADEIYVITPFKNVAYRLAQELDKIKFTKRKDKKPMNVGTVHTFQGKEAKIVYLVLGADSESKGAAYWAVSEPNIMNVAATRAKEEFYIIGDRSLYAKLGSNVANTTLRIIDDYNAELARWSEL